MAKEEFIIRRRSAWEYLGELKFEIECDPTQPHRIKLGLAIKAAVKSRADLSGADLSGADLSGAYLSGADLSGAYLSGAYLSGADLSRADLSGAYLSGADLSGADLSRADLSGADLSDEALRPFKADLWTTILSLRAAPLEIVHLITKLRNGQVDGGTYGKPGMACACLVGTLAQPRGVHGEELDHNSSRPAERWFMMIKPGDKPGAVHTEGDKVGKETGGGFAARKALEWTLELAEALSIEIEPKAAPEPEAV